MLQNRNLTTLATVGVAHWLHQLNSLIHANDELEMASYILRLAYSPRAIPGTKYEIAGLCDNGELIYSNRSLHASYSDSMYILSLEFTPTETITYRAGVVFTPIRCFLHATPVVVQDECVSSLTPLDGLFKGVIHLFCKTGDSYRDRWNSMIASKYSKRLQLR